MHFCTQKASGDKAVTSGDGFSGLEFAGFSGQKTEFGARQTREAGFRRKTSELGGSGTTFDVWHEKTNFSELAVFSAFCTKNGVVTKTGDIGKTFSWLKNLLFWSVLGPKITLELGYYKQSFLTTFCMILLARVCADLCGKSSDESFEG